MLKSLAMALLLCCLIMAAVGPTSGAAAGSTSGSESTLTNKVRYVRGFRHSQLATARGFGKRTSADLLESLLASDNGGVSTTWPVEQLAKSSQIAEILLRKFVDADGDGMITADELSRDV